MKTLKDEKGQHFVADLNNKPFNTYRYDKIGNIKNNLRVVTIDKKKGLSDMEGKLIIPCAYDTLDIINEDMVFVTFEIQSTENEDLQKQAFAKFSISENEGTLKRWLKHFNDQIGTEY